MGTDLMVVGQIRCTVASQAHGTELGDTEVAGLRLALRGCFAVDKPRFCLPSSC